MTLSASSLKERAHEAFIAGEYNNALHLFDSLSRDSSQSQQISAIELRAVIFEEYLGEIDSAITHFTILLDKPLSHRKKQRIKKRLNGLLALGHERELYSNYKKTVMLRIPPKAKIKLLEEMRVSHPDFSLKNELCELLITEYHVVGNYVEAEKLLFTMKKEGFHVSEQRLLAARHYAIRHRLHWISILILGIIGLSLIVNLFKSKSITFKRFTLLLVSWGVVAVIFELIYLRWFLGMDNNPFFWYSPLLLFSLFIIPLTWSITMALKYRDHKLVYLIFFPTALAILASFHLFLYSHKNSTEIIDVFEDRFIEVFTSDKTGK